MTFIEYVKARRISDTPSGDFTMDARRDKSLPDAKSWTDLRCYLIRKGAGEEVLSAARGVWNAYQAKLKRT